MRSTLILGEPGVGKTLTLLKIAKKLIENSKEDIKQPIPVVMNLSSWQRKRQSISKWLVEELKNLYGTNEKIAEAWIANGELLLLLDGLDRVSVRWRKRCILKLKNFLDKHREIKIVISCCTQDYIDLSHQFDFKYVEDFSRLLRFYYAFEPLPPGLVGGGG